MSGSLFVWEGSRKGEHNWYEDQHEGLSSVMRVAHDSSFCRRSQVEFRLCGGEAVDGARLAAFRSPPPPLRAPLIDYYRAKRWQVAAALSAAVTSTQSIGATSTSQAEPSKPKRSNPNASRSSGGSAREGLLSEKPPPSHTHVHLIRTRGSRRRRTFRCSACSRVPCRSGGRSGALPPKEHPQNPDE